MKRQSQVLLAVAIVAAGAAGCFKDPVSSGLGTPASLSTSAQTVTLKTGDSVSVIAYLKDKAGNGLAVTGAVWTSVAPAIAVVDTLTTAQQDSQPIPANAFTRAVIKAVSTDGGWTYVIVSSRGIADTIRVFVVPAIFTSNLMSVSGTAGTDTVIIPANALAGTPAKPVPYSAADTLVLSGTSRLTFDTSQAAVSVATAAGMSQGYIVQKTPAQLKVVFVAGTAGPVMIQHLIETPGNASIGAFPVDTLITDSVAVSRARYRGNISQTGDTISLDAVNGIHYGAGTVVNVGATTLIVFDTTGPALAVSPATVTGLATFQNIGLGGALLPTLTSVAAATVTKSAFGYPDVGISQVADTLTVTGNGRVAVDSQTTVAFGATAATVLKRGTNSVSVILGAASYTGAVTVQKATLGIARIATLKTVNSYTINQASFLGAIAVVGDTMTITAPAGETFDAQTSAAFGGNNPAIILSSNATTMKVLSPVAVTNGPVQVTNLLLGTVRVPAMISTGTYTIGAAQFPSANVSVGAGNLGDTIVVTAPAGYSFKPTGSLILAGNLAISTSDTAWMLSRTASTLKAFAKRGGGGPVRVTNVVIPGGVVVPYLTTPTNFPIDSVATDLPSGPTEGSALAATIPASGVDTVYGSVNVGTSPQDFWTFTTTTTHNISAKLSWFGTGNPGYGGAGNSDKAHTADLDLLLCNTGLACDESVADLFNYGGASAGQPEAGGPASLPAAQYWVTAIAYTAGAETIVYQLIITVK